LGCAIKPDSLGKWVLLITASLGSHVILDLIPHWERPSELTWVVADFLLGSIMAFLIIYISKIVIPVIVGALLGVIPDIEHKLVSYGLMEEKLFISHLQFFPHQDWNFPWGVLIQIVFLGATLLLCYYLGKR